MCVVRLVLCATISVSAFHPSVAAARSSTVEVAKKHYQAGKRHFGQKHYRKALEQFHQAHRHWRNRVILFNIALCYAKLGQPVLAVRYLRIYLRGATAAERALPEILRRVLTQVGILHIRTPVGQAAIFVRGKLVGHGEVEHVVAPGAHVVDIRLKGQVVLRRRLTATAGRTERWTLQQLPKPRQPKPRASRSRAHPAYFYSAVGLAAAAFGAGLALYFKTDQIHKDYEEQNLPELRSKGLRYQAATNALLGVSAAGLVTAGILAIFTRWRRTVERPVAVTIVPPSHGRGAVIGLTWTR